MMTLRAPLEVEEKALIKAMVQVAMREGDVDLQEKLMSAGLSLLKSLLPRAHSMDMIAQVKALMEAGLRKGERS